VRTTSNDDEPDDHKPLLADDSGESKGHVGETECLTGYRGAIQTHAIKAWNNVSERLQQVDMQKVYQYWSALRDWLSEVPEMARNNLPESLSSYFLAKTPELTPEEEDVLRIFVENNVGIPYTHEEHFDELLQVWDLSFPNADHKPAQSDKEWKRLGFQGDNPATDFRAAGVLPVRCLKYFVEMYPDKYREIMKRSHGTCIEDSFPFACAAINLVHMLTDIMKLRNHNVPPSNDPNAAHLRAMFGRMLAAQENTFLELLCVVFIALDDEWVRTHATYMQFPVVLKTTREHAASALRHPSCVNPAAFAKRMGVDLYGEPAE